VEVNSARTGGETRLKETAGTRFRENLVGETRLPELFFIGYSQIGFAAGAFSAIEKS
jgi:hypothetical protein